MALASVWGTVNSVLLEPLNYINSAWGTVNSVINNPYISGAVPSVYDHTTGNWVTAQTVRWDATTQQWLPQ